MSFSLPKFNGGVPPGLSAGIGPVSQLPAANPAFPTGNNLAGNTQFAFNFNATQNPNGNFGGFRI